MTGPGVSVLEKVSRFSNHLSFLMLNIGAFGNVKYAWLKKDKSKKVAIKAMKKKDIIQSKHVDHIENERKILELMQHPFIVSYLLFLSSYDFCLSYRWNTTGSCRTRDTFTLSPSCWRVEIYSRIIEVLGISTRSRLPATELRLFRCLSICRARRSCIETWSRKT